MNLSRNRRMPLAGVAVASMIAAAATGGASVTTNAKASVPQNFQFRERALMAQGTPTAEGEEARIAAEQYAQARQAPGVVAPGAYDAAWSQMKNLPTYAGTWAETTN